MKMTEFYEKYWMVNGKPVPPLDPREKAIWDAAEEIGEAPYLKVWKRKYGWQYIINPLVQKHINLNQ